MTAQQNFSRLVRYIYDLDDVGVAFSGGTNSSLLLCAAEEAHGKNVWAITANLAFMMQEELFHVREVLSDYSLRDARIPVYILQNEGIAFHSADSCNLCRRMISERLAREAANLGVSVLLDGRLCGGGGGCFDGRLAAAVKCASPLAELKFSRLDIEEMLYAVGRGYYIRKQAICLADCFPKGMHLVPEQLDLADAAEQHLRKFAGRRCNISLSEHSVELTSDAEFTGSEKQVAENFFIQNGFKKVTFLCERAKKD